MTIKRKLCKRINGEKEYYLEDKEYHSFEEIKEVCYKNAERTLISDITKYTFVIMDTDEEIDITCHWKRDSDDFYYVCLEAMI